MATGGTENSTLALHITNFPPTAAEGEYFDMFLENKTKQENFSIEYNATREEALVMFSNLTLSSSEIVSRIQQEPLLGNSLTVNEAHSNSRVFVTGIKSNVEQQLLELYFESARLNPSGCSVKVEFDSSSRAAIVTFSDPSVIDTITSADHSKILGSDVLVQRCSYFDSLSNYASSLVEEAELETLSNAGSTLADDQVFDGSEDATENGETGSVSGEANPRGRGYRGRRRGGRGGRRGGYRGGRRGNFGAGGHGEGLRERHPSVSSVNSESVYGGEEDGVSRGNRRWGRGRRPGTDTGLPRNSEGGRPPSGRGRGGEYQENSYADRGIRRGGHRPFVARESPASGDHGYSSADRGNRRGNRRPYGGTDSRRGERADSAGPRQDGPNQRAGSIPNLLDQPISIPPGSISKEIEIKNEVRNEKCLLLMTMIREIKARSGCNAHIEMRRHCVSLIGPESAVIAATEDVYSRLCAMHSVKLELPPSFAKKLETRDGHRQLIDFFKAAQIQATYYTDADGRPAVIAGDEYSAASAVAQLMGKIKTTEINYNDRHASYLVSVEWNNFVSSAQKDWLLAIELTPRSSILVVGIASDVEGAARSIQSQLDGIDQPSRSRHGSSTADPKRHGKVKAQRQHSSQEQLEPCPICGDNFPLSAIAAHAEQCMENRRCPVCSGVFSATTKEFQRHVDSHFD